MQLAKILVVDDEPDLQALISQKFRNKIKAKEYEFYFAENGVQALEKIAKDGIDRSDLNRHQYARDGWTYTSFKNK